MPSIGQLSPRGCKKHSGHEALKGMSDGWRKLIKHTNRCGAVRTCSFSMLFWQNMSECNDVQKELCQCSEILRHWLQAKIERLRALCTSLPHSQQIPQFETPQTSLSIHAKWSNVQKCRYREIRCICHIHHDCATDTTEFKPFPTSTISSSIAGGMLRLLWHLPRTQLEA